MNKKLLWKIAVGVLVFLLFTALETGFIVDQWKFQQIVPEKSIEEIPAITLPTAIVTCLEEEKCFNSTTLRVQQANCTIIPQNCPEGCFNNSCLAVVCSEKYQCQNSTARARQNKDCSWGENETCEFGCEEGKCLAEVVSIAVNESAGPLGNGNVLYAGKKKEVSANGNGYNLSIYLIEDNQVRIKINDDKSDWLTTGMNFTSYGITFTPLEIYFQSWGLQAVVYELK